MKISEVDGKSVEFTGILHLYNHGQVVEQQNTLMILSIPDYTTPQDLLGLMGSHREGITHIRIILDKIPKRYMMLIKYSSPKPAQEFFKDFNGRPFSSFEAEICHLVWIKSVVIETDEQVFPFLKDMKTDTESAIPIELPTCPVCLERMDSSITTLLTSICHHTFHCSCILKWGDTTCPVCRFNPSRPSSESICSTCSSTHNLWICIICGNVGCGRYSSGHAAQHFGEEGHVYALEVDTQRVWDYKGDGYVHRVLQNTEGKVVHLPPLDGNVQREGLDTLHPDSVVTSTDIQLAQKMEAVGDQVSEMISTTLARQSLVHEKALGKVELGSVERISYLESVIVSLEEENLKFWRERKGVGEELKEWQRRAEKSEGRLEKVTSRLITAEKRVEEECLLNDSLRKNLAIIEKEKTQTQLKLKSQGLEIDELREQVRDIMFFLETQQKIGVVDGIEGGSVVGVVSPKVSPEKKGTGSSSSGGNSNGKGKKKK